MIDWTQQVWMDSAACRGMDTELFFPVRGETTAEAQAACAGCGVRTECLDFALGVSDRFLQGVWGGLSARQRRKARQARGRPA